VERETETGLWVVAGGIVAAAIVLPFKRMPLALVSPIIVVAFQNTFVGVF
jgi:hypothetical protein